MLFVGNEKLYVKGVTYGPFRPDETGCEYHTPESVLRDFAEVKANGFNTVRTYTVPPRWLLDAAHDHQLQVMVGVPWEQHVTFYDEPKIRRRIERRIAEGVRACAGHPAVLAYAIGNEIPAPIVRWYGRRRVEKFVHRLFRIAKHADPAALVTYVNYPTTEYLQLPFLDFVCFNVYLESQERLADYLARLQNIAGDRPLVMTELGLDSLRNGEDVQAASVKWQTHTALASGCAGVFVFAWTDEWHRGGQDIDDWAFGLTDRQRRPKPALSAIREAFSQVPLHEDTWPKMSVVVCTHNGSATIRECFEAITRLDYPAFETIVVDDGSSDNTADICREFNARLITTENGGLSNARNIGLQAATGEIVAYTDDDAYPDPHWLKHLAHTFMTTSHVGVGGPNIPPPGDGPIAECIANAPGGPSHVLYSDREVEHIPGCNMAFRREALAAVTGFDPQFRIAGDDVDLCWRLQRSGGSLGFNSAAVVWHHRRDSVRAYMKQQFNYGKAEAMLEEKWPEKYNGLGHIPWKGRLYGQGPTLPLFLRRWRIYHGVWGSGPFQSIYARAPGLFRSLPLMPEWYLVVAVLTVLALLSVVWKLMLFAIPVLVVAIALPILQAGMSAAHASLGRETRTTAGRVMQRFLTTLLHLAQPLVRLAGRLRLGLTPWRRRHDRYALPRRRSVSIWSERWTPSDKRLEALEAALRNIGGWVRRGGDYDRWDLEVRGGMLGVARILVAIEEHGAGKQLVRIRAWPKVIPWAFSFFLVFAGLSVAAALDGAWTACAILGVFAAVIALQALGDCASATALVLEGVGLIERGERT
jgi:GT2 family glycosyltransferase